jgi:hypothetical protein
MKLRKGTGAVSRYKVDRSNILVQVQDFSWLQLRVSGCNSYYEFILCAGAVCKNRDKLITLTVRVSGALLFFLFCQVINVNIGITRRPSIISDET